MTAAAEALLVVDPSADFAIEVSEVVTSHAVVHVASPAAIQQAAPRAAVVLVGPGADLTEVLESLGDDHGHGLVVVAPRLLTRVMREAMRAGAVDVLTPQSTPDELRDAVGRARAVVRAAGPSERPEEPEPTAPVESRGRVVTVFSTKGGSGKSVVATNLAIGLQARGLRTCLVDLDLQFGDVAIMLQLRPDRSLADAIVQSSPSLPVDFDDYVALHGTGLEVLCAPDDPAVADQVTGAGVTDILDALVDRYDRVVIDTPSQFTDPVLAAIDGSDSLILVGNLDVPSIKNLRLGLATLQRLGVDQRTVHVVMNRANSRVGLRMREVEQSLGVPVAVQIPSDRDVVLSLNHGTPICIERPRSPVVAALAQLADVVEGVARTKRSPASPARRALRRRGGAAAAASPTTPTA